MIKLRAFRSHVLPCLVGVVAILVSACAPASEQSYKAKFGPYKVKTKEAIVLNDPEQGRDVTLRVVYPEAEEGSFPIVVYSHGAFCFPQMYANVVEHWASYGYIVILPNHIDSPNQKERADLSKRDLLLLSRVRDMSFALDALDDIETALPAIQGKTDREHMAVAGHSFGGMISMIKAGLPLKNSETGAKMDLSDKRFDASVVMSGVGEMVDMAEGAFAELTLPTFASGGTLDLGNVGDGQIHPWEWRMGAYRLTPPGDKYELVLDEGDHYLGGLICRENRGGVPDAQGVSIVNSLSTAFLDAYVKGDAEAHKYLKSANVDALTGGRATFSRK